MATRKRGWPLVCLKTIDRRAAIQFRFDPELLRGLPKRGLA